VTRVNGSFGVTILQILPPGARWKNSSIIQITAKTRTHIIENEQVQSLLIHLFNYAGT